MAKEEVVILQSGSELRLAKVTKTQVGGSIPLVQVDQATDTVVYSVEVIKKTESVAYIKIPLVLPVGCDANVESLPAYIKQHLRGRAELLAERDEDIQRLQWEENESSYKATEIGIE